MKKMKKVLAVVLILVMVFALSACGNSSSGGSADAGRTDLVFRLKSEPPTLDWCKVSDLPTNSVFCQIADTLVQENEKGEIVPGLAESWEILDEGKTVRFYLRKDVKFHNGEMMTAEDVAYSMNRAIGSSITVLTTSSMESAEVIDEYTVDLHLKYAFEPILKCLVYPNNLIASKKAIEDIGEEAFARSPVYSGPYKVTEWQAGDYIVVEANEDYWGGSPAIKKITFKIIPEASTAAIALQTGEIDIMQDPDSSDRETLIANEKISFIETPEAGTYYVGFNNEEGVFADERMREAVCLAVDREEIVMGTFDGNAPAISNPLPTAVFGYDPAIKTKERDIKKAKQLVIDAGYPNGVDVDIYTPDDPTYLNPTEILQSQLAEIGINLKIHKLDRGVWMTKVYYNMEYEITIGSLIASYPDADYEWVEYHSSEAHLFNYLLTQDKTLDGYLETGRYSTDEEIRQQAYTDMAQYIVDHSLVCPLFNKMNQLAYNSNLQGVTTHSIGLYHVFNYSWS